MRISRGLVRTALAAALAGSALTAVPSSAGPVPPPPAPSALPVASRTLPLSAYRALGLAPVEAGLQKRLDHLASQGVSAGMLDAARASYKASGSGVVAVFADLFSLGDLDGRAGNEVLESRYVSNADKTQTVQIVVRDAATGRALWQRTDRLTSSQLQFAVPAPVGPAQKPGLVLIQDDFSKDTEKATALDARGKKVWQTAVVPPKPVYVPPQSLSVNGSYGGTFTYTLTYVGAHVRQGAADLVMVRSANEIAQGDLMSSRSGGVAFSAVSLADGVSRALPGSTSSQDGAAFGDLLPDADGDGLLDLLVASSGTAAGVQVLRAVDGRQVWSRDDAVSGDLEGASVVSPVVAEKAGGHLVDDVVLMTRPAPNPVQQALGQQPDPAVQLLGGHTGKTALSGVGDLAYPGGQRTLVLSRDASTSGETSDTAAVEVTKLDASGRVRWTRTVSEPRKHGAEQEHAAFAVALPYDDFEQDGAVEIVAITIHFDGSEFQDKDHLLRGRDGAPQPALPGRALGGGVTRGHHAVGTVDVASSGVVVSVYDAVTRTRVFRRAVPRTAGVTLAFAYADDVTRHVCDDVVVFGGGRSRTVVAVLASTGALRWSVSRDGAGTGTGTVVRPKAAPAVRC